MLCRNCGKRQDQVLVRRAGHPGLYAWCWPCARQGEKDEVAVPVQEMGFLPLVDEPDLDYPEPPRGWEP